METPTEEEEMTLDKLKLFRLPALSVILLLGALQSWQWILTAYTIIQDIRKYIRR